MRAEVANLVGGIIDVKDESVHVKLLGRLRDLLDSLTPCTYKQQVAQPSYSEHGSQLSPQDAANCIEGHRRTVRYWKAMLQQLENLQSSTDVIHVMYPGCGPYGTLVLPLLAMATFDKVSVTFIDVHKTSTDNLKQLVSVLGLSEYVQDIICEDALAYDPQQDIDILVLECMKSGLYGEPQVAITNHFAKRLSQHGAVIPEHIEISAQLINLAAEQRYISEQLQHQQQVCPLKLAENRVDLGHVLTLDHKTYTRVDATSNTILCQDIDIPVMGGNGIFALCTRMQLADGITLEEYDNGITYPYYPAFDIATVSRVNLAYQLGSYPEFICR